MTTGAPAGMTTLAVGTGGSNVVYAGNGANTLWAFDDVFATGKPILTSPGDGATVGIDPVTGRADLVDMSFSPLGTGTAAGNRIACPAELTPSDAGSGDTPFLS